MTITASRALSLLIPANHRDISEQLQGCLKEIEESLCDLVGIAVCGEMAEAFIADFPGPVEEEIHRFEQRRSVWIWEYPDARWYLCRDGHAKAVDRTDFFARFWLRLAEIGKRQARN